MYIYKKYTYAEDKDPAVAIGIDHCEHEADCFREVVGVQSFRETCVQLVVPETPHLVICDKRKRPDNV